MEELLLYMFSEAGDDDVRAAIDHFGLADIDFGAEVIRDGDAEHTLFIVVDGDLDVRKDQVELMTVRSGAMFGELGAFGHGTRITTVKAATPCQLLYIERDALRDLQTSGNLVAWVLEVRALGTLAARLREVQIRVLELARHAQKTESLPAPGVREWLGHSLGLWGRSAGGPEARRALLSSLPYFHDLDPVLIATIAKSMHAVRYRAGSFICRDGDPADEVYLIAEGAIEVLLSMGDDKAIPTATLASGMFFGVSAMLQGDATRNASCRALGDVTLLCLPTDDWERYANEPGDAPSAMRSAMILTLAGQLETVLDHLVALRASTYGELHEVLNQPDGDDVSRTRELHDRIFKN